MSVSLLPPPCLILSTQVLQTALMCILWTQKALFFIWRPGMGLIMFCKEYLVFLWTSHGVWRGSNDSKGFQGKMCHVLVSHRLLHPIWVVIKNNRCVGLFKSWYFWKCTCFGFWLTLQSGLLAWYTAHIHMHSCILHLISTALYWTLTQCPPGICQLFWFLWASLLSGQGAAVKRGWNCFDNQVSSLTLPPLDPSFSFYQLSCLFD